MPSDTAPGARVLAERHDMLAPDALLSHTASNRAAREGWMMSGGPGAVVFRGRAGRCRRPRDQ